MQRLVRTYSSSDQEEDPLSLVTRLNNNLGFHDRVLILIKLPYFSFQALVPITLGDLIL